MTGEFLIDTPAGRLAVGDRFYAEPSSIIATMLPRRRRRQRWMIARSVGRSSSTGAVWINAMQEYSHSTRAVYPENVAGIERPGRPRAGASGRAD